MSIAPRRPRDCVAAPDERPWIPPPPPLDLDTPIVLPDAATLERAAALLAAHRPQPQRSPRMAEKPKPKVDELIRREADVAEANQNPVAAAALRQVADEMDNTKNGSVPPEKP